MNAHFQSVIAAVALLLSMVGVGVQMRSSTNGRDTAERKQHDDEIRDAKVESRAEAAREYEPRLAVAALELRQWQQYAAGLERELGRKNVD